MIKVKDLIGKTVRGTAQFDTPEEIEGIVGAIDVNEDEVSINEGGSIFEISLESITHIDGIPVIHGYEFRAVEMYYGIGDDSGTWDTEHILIPYDTDDDKVEEVALETYRNHLQETGESVQILGVYAIPPIEDAHEFCDEIIFYPCFDVKFIGECLMMLYRTMGIDKPSNHDKILEFVVEDVMETADNVNWHSGDVDIAFRRWIERD